MGERHEAPGPFSQEAQAAADCLARETAQAVKANKGARAQVRAHGLARRVFSTVKD